MKFVETLVPTDIRVSFARALSEDPERRKLFLRIGQGSVLVAGSLLIKDPAADFALSVPSVVETSGNFAGYDIYPGWIEANTTSPLIQRDKGHTHWLREAVFNNKAVFQTSKEFFNYLLENQMNQQRVELGASLFQAIRFAGRTLTNLGLSETHPDTEFRLEAIRLGLFAFAAGFITWFRKEDYQKLGATFEDNRSVVSFFWNSQRGVGTNVFPRLFGFSDDEAAKYPFEEDVEPRFTGEDRVLHFSQHLLLGFEYLYSLRFGLKEHKRIPFLLSTILALNPFERSLEDRARLFSKLLGIFYEVSKTDLGQALAEKPEFIHEGIFDYMVEPDYKANALGAEAATVLWRRIMADRPITPILAALDDPRLRDINSSPTLKK